MRGYTYDTLVSDLARWAENDSPEFLAAMPRIIAIGSEKVLRDLDVSVVDSDVEAYLTVGNEYLKKPGDYAHTISVSCQGAGGNSIVEERTSSYVKDYLGNSSLGLPRYYCDADEHSIMLAPRPDLGYLLRLRYACRPKPLTPQRTTTWASLQAPEAVLYACLVQCEAFVKDDGRIETWLSLYNSQTIPAYRQQFAGQIRSRYAAPALSQES